MIYTIDTEERSICVQTECTVGEMIEILKQIRDDWKVVPSEVTRYEVLPIQAGSYESVPSSNIMYNSEAALNVHRFEQ